MATVAPKNESRSSARKLLESGLIFAAINFLTALGNMAFQSVLGHHLQVQGQYGTANSAINALMPLLGLPPQIAIFAVTHYIAHFNSLGDTARLQGLLAGCRRFVFHLTLVGSVLAVIAIKPLSVFFNYHMSVMLITLLCTLLGLWTSLATALCQGLSWFKRLALVGFIAMALKVSFGFAITLKWPTPETAVMATIVSLLAYLILLFWKKELSLRGQVAISPWNHEFVLYLVISGALVVGNYCFTLSDLLVMQRYFPKGGAGDAYTAAERLAFALPVAVGPLLTVLFTNRSVERSADALGAQLKLLGLYAGGLLFGGVCLFVLRHFCLQILGKDSPEAAGMIGYLEVTMILVGLLQAVGTWALASRWIKVSLLYGFLGIAYTTLILTLGRTPATLLHLMPFAAGAAFAILITIWLIAMRRHRPTA